jgi:hypothetical protein
MTLIADTLRESGDMEHWPLRPCSSGSASPVHVRLAVTCEREEAATQTLPKPSGPLNQSQSP